MTSCNNPWSDDLVVQAQTKSYRMVLSPLLRRLRGPRWNEVQLLLLYCTFKAGRGAS